MEMANFPMGVVLRGFMPSTYAKYAEDKTPCVALLFEKIAHFQIYLQCAVNSEILNPQLTNNE